MTIDEMETLLRQYLENPSTGSFSQAEAFRLINKSYEHLYNLIVRNNQNFFATTGTLSLVANTETYTLPAAMNRIILVERVDQDPEVPVPFISYTRRTEFLEPNGAGSNERSLRCYLRGNSIGFVPVPTGAATNAIRISYVPPVTQLTTGNSPPTEWPTDLHEAIVFGALLRKGIQDREERKLRESMYQEMKLALLEHTAIRQTQTPKHFEFPTEEELGW